MATTTQLRAAYEYLELTIMELWMDYFALGGNHNAGHLHAYLHEDATCHIDPRDRDHIIDALNDAFVERGDDHLLTHGST